MLKCQTAKPGLEPFFNPNRGKCVTKAGHQTNKVEPKAPGRDYSALGSRLGRRSYTALSSKGWSLCFGQA